MIGSWSGWFLTPRRLDKPPKEFGIESQRNHTEPRRIQLTMAPDTGPPNCSLSSGSVLVGWHARKDFVTTAETRPSAQGPVATIAGRDAHGAAPGPPEGSAAAAAASCSKAEPVPTGRRPARKSRLWSSRPHNYHLARPHEALIHQP